MRSDDNSRYKKRDVELDSALILSRDTIRTGVSTSGGERNHLFMNVQGRDFQEVSGLSGLDSPADGRSFAWLDIDRDGALDVAVVNANAPMLQLFHNDIDVGEFLALRLVGGNDTAGPSEAWSPRDGYGARVTVSVGGHTIHREHQAGAGRGAQNSSTLVIGVGEHTKVDSVRVVWPSGRAQLVGDLPTGQQVVLYEDPEQSPSKQSWVSQAYSPNTHPPARFAEEPGALRVGHQRSSRLRAYVTMATWCGSCKEALPQLARLRAHFSDGDLGLYAVPLQDEGKRKLDDYWRVNTPAYQLLDLSSADDAELARGVLDLAESALPWTLIANEDGVVVGSMAGVPTLSDLENLL